MNMSAGPILLGGDREWVAATKRSFLVLLKDQRFEEAEVALRRIARLQPEIAYHRYRLAQFYERIGEPGKAARARAKAEEIAPQDRKMRPLRPSRK